MRNFKKFEMNQITVTSRKSKIQENLIEKQLC